MLRRKKTEKSDHDQIMLHLPPASLTA